MRVQRRPGRPIKIAVVVICFPLYLPYHLIIRPWRRRREEKFAKEWDLARRTPPAPEKRKRALSIFSTRSTHSAQKPPLSPSPLVERRIGFLSLPSELRNKIYEEYMDFDQICLYCKNGYLRAFGRRGPGYRAVGTWPVDMLPLLQTCHQVYREAIPLLYSTKTFCFLTPMNFVSFAGSILSQRFALLSSIVMSMGEGCYCRLPDGVSARFDYRKLPHQIRVLSQLPQTEVGARESFWSMSCILMASLPNLKYVKLLIEQASPWEHGTNNYAPFFSGLHRLQRQDTNVDIHFRGDYVKRNYSWRSKEEEVVWADCHGDLLSWRKSDRRQTWWDEWLVIQDEMRDGLSFRRELSA